MAPRQCARVFRSVQSSLECSVRKQSGEARARARPHPRPHPSRFRSFSLFNESNSTYLTVRWHRTDKSTTACATTILRTHSIGFLCPTSTSRTAQSRSMATPRRSHAYAAAARTLLGPPPTSICEPNGRRSPRGAVGSSGERRQAAPRLYEPSHVPNRSTRVD